MTLQFSLSGDAAPQTECDCLVVGVYEKGAMTAAATALDQASNGAITRLTELGEPETGAGGCAWLYGLPGVASPRVLVVNLGKQNECRDLDFRKVAGKAAQQLAAAPIRNAATWLSEAEVQGRDEGWKISQLALAADHAAYRFKVTHKKDTRKRIESLAIAGDAAHAGVLQRTCGIAEGIRWTRDLANTPPNICTPAWLASEAERIAAENDDVEAEIHDPEALREMGANALLAVGAGSANGPRLIVLKYQGDGDAKPYALVGKGVTFDAGGIDIKPAAGMEEMKFDMGGAAGVMGTFLAAVKMQLKLNLVCVVASAENMPDGKSYRPSDVLETMSGQTVEVLNTDAEGRLCLCDALHFVRRFDPQVVIDAATLTGACVVALGKVATGLMSTDEQLAAELLESGQRSLDRAWRLPLWDDYQEQLDTGSADFANIGTRWGGAITAGCFLSRFTKGYRWAHLDIAGTAWTSGRKGSATGRPVALLADWLAGKAA